MERCVGPGLDDPGGGIGLRRVSSHDPANVAVHASHGLLECDAGDRSRCVRSNPRQGKKVVVGTRQFSVEPSLCFGEHHPLTQGVQTTGSAVVAGPFPGFQHRINADPSHGFDGGKRIHHPLPVHQTATHLGLLQQNLGQENVPRVVGASPRQVPSMAVVPRKQGLLVVACQPAAPSGFCGFRGRFGRCFLGFDFGIVGLDLLPNAFGDVLHFHLGTDGAQPVRDHR